MAATIFFQKTELYPPSNLHWTWQALESIGLFDHMIMKKKIKALHAW